MGRDMMKGRRGKWGSEKDGLKEGNNREKIGRERSRRDGEEERSRGRGSEEGTSTEGKGGVDEGWWCNGRQSRRLPNPRSSTQIMEIRQISG
ncbi:hypothetical protein Pcinc_021892 [Petrolisthes cinctipes]|uniref:Uncharacterized protein n=1 Tax=Petrolisthes cinctipes TaxID=88211 RepID=A0AAE1FFP9_PETCI|nr:hypothetical protein Pcinc_021892 [Petrolisthes cinctipes]